MSSMTRSAGGAPFPAATSGRSGAEVGDEPGGHLVVVRRARPEVPRRLAEQPFEVVPVAGNLVKRLADVPRAGDVVRRSAGHRQRQVPGAMVADLEQRVGGKLGE